MNWVEVIGLEGVCPACDEPIPNYDVLEADFPYVFYPWTCGNCGQTGREYYKLEFDGHMIPQDKK